jgi:hypothetical protein
MPGAQLHHADDDLDRRRDRADLRDPEPEHPEVDREVG